MDLSRYAALFVTESREHLGACGQALLEWERDPRATEPVVALFRAMHTFKGMAAAMGYANLTELAHRTESVLDLVRSDPALATRDLHDLLFQVVDALEAGASEAIAGGDTRLDFTALLTALDQTRQASRPTGSWAVPDPLLTTAEMRAVAAGRLVRLSIARAASMRGARALLAIRRAEALGTVSAIRPPVSMFEQDDFDGQVSFRVDAHATDAELIAAIQGAGEVERVELGEAPVESSPTAQRDTDVGGRSRQIRVDLRRLDALMNQVGELVVAKGRLAELLVHEGSPELQAVSARIARVTAEMQAEIIQARMTPVWQVFDRFPRVVRDLSRQLGKRVTFEVSGEEIELDRTLLDEIGEPLIHLLRNAIDHGIEAPSERTAAGKPAEGRVALRARRERTSVAIEVTDDGRGIDRAGVLERARQEGLVDSAAATLSDDLLLRIVSRPGFSTAATVTDVSGRGMGMDAVASRVRALGGSVEVDSTPGQGTTFTLRLPPTLAIVRALLARVGPERYAVPLASVAETVEFDPKQAASVHGREALVIRDEVIPTVRMREHLGVNGGEAPVGRPPTLILEVGGRRAAIVVDALVGQQEIVVEPFDAPRGMLPMFSGATILGDGVPALIVDPAALV